MGYNKGHNQSFKKADTHDCNVYACSCRVPRRTLTFLASFVFTRFNQLIRLKPSKLNQNQSLPKTAISCYEILCPLLHLTEIKQMTALRKSLTPLIKPLLLISTTLWFTSLDVLINGQPLNREQNRLMLRLQQQQIQCHLTVSYILLLRSHMLAPVLPHCFGIDAHREDQAGNTHVIDSQNEFLDAFFRLIL